MKRVSYRNLGILLSRGRRISKARLAFLDSSVEHAKNGTNVPADDRVTASGEIVGLQPDQPGIL